MNTDQPMPLEEVIARLQNGPIDTVVERSALHHLEAGKRAGWKFWKDDSPEGGHYTAPWDDGKGPGESYREPMTNEQTNALKSCKGECRCDMVKNYVHSALGGVFLGELEDAVHFCPWCGGSLTTPTTEPQG